MRKTYTVWLLMAFAIFSVKTAAQQTESPAEDPPKTELTEEQLRERYEQSMSYLLRRADLARALAAELLVHMDENAAAPEIHLIEEAGQVLAYDVVCGDDIINAKGLQHIATASTYKIAVVAGRSPIVAKLSEIGQQQPIRDRIEPISRCFYNSF